MALAIGYVVFGALPASGNVADAKAGEPLYKRVRGYDAAQAQSYWAALKNKQALGSERALLIIDLAYPLLYGGALAMAILASSSMLGRPGFGGWLLVLLAPVLIVVAADWTENLVLLAQLNRFETTGVLSAQWIRVASVATTLKIVFLAVALLETVGLAVWVVRQS